MKDKYVIMHKDYPVISVRINDSFTVEKIIDLHSVERLFPGLNGGKLSKEDINEWFFGRGIPAKRNELSEILDCNAVSSREELVIKNYGLCLTDNYWIQKENENLKWDNINFWDNDFTQEKDNVYLGQPTENIMLLQSKNTEITPNNVSSGMLPKTWKRIDGDLYMIKGADTRLQEPFNESVVSQFLEKLKIEHVPYELYWRKELPFSKCPIMLEKGEELIHSFYLNKTGKKENNVSYYEHYINQCVSMGLSKNIRKDLENMILVDFMTANTDRHWSNFGVIRDSETLIAKRLAPLYDHGASFYTKYHTLIIPNTLQTLKCRSFKNTQWHNIKLVKDFSLLEDKNIFILPSLLEKEYIEKYIGLDRKDIIINWVCT